MERTRGVLYGWAKSNVGSVGREGQNLWQGKITGDVKKSSCKDMMKILRFFLASVFFLWDSALLSGLAGVNPLCAMAMEGQWRGWPDGTPLSRPHVSGTPLSLCLLVQRSPLHSLCLTPVGRWGLFLTGALSAPEILHS